LAKLPLNMLYNVHLSCRRYFTFRHV